MKRSKKQTGNRSTKAALRLNLRAYSLIWRQDPAILLSIACHRLAAAFTLYVPIWYSAQILNELSAGRDPVRLTRLALAVILITAAAALVTALLNRWEQVHQKKIFLHMQHILSQKMLTLDFASMDDPRTHDLLSQVTQNANWGGWGLIKSVSCFQRLVKHICRAGGAVALTISLFLLPVPSTAGALTLLNHPLFALLVLLALLGAVLLSAFLSNRADAHWAAGAAEARFGNRLFFYFGSLGQDRARALDIRIYRQDILSRRQWASGQDSSFSPKGPFARYARKTGGFLKAASAAITTLFIGIVYVYVGLKAYGGAFGVGSITQYVGAITTLSGSIAGLLTALGSMVNNVPFLDTLFAFLDIPNDMYQGSLTVEKRSDRKYDIEFRDVSFRYPHTEAWALRHVSMRFQVGQRLAVVGENGSGKTTFIKLLCRLYDPTEGQILLNGIDIRKYNYQEYLSIFSVVFQDFKLFSLPLGQNVAASRRYDAVRARACLTEAGLGEKLPSIGLEDYLYKDLNERGVEISGGEAQKIAIARALYKDVPFIVLDEPTAALDPIAEAEIYARFNEIVGDKTAVYISHRLSSCRFCDDILVFDGGRIVQQGRHDTLVLDPSGKYYALWLAQAQYYSAHAQA